MVAVNVLRAKNEKRYTAYVSKQTQSMKTKLFF